MKISGKIFTFGLLTSSFNYFKKSKLGVLLVTHGVLVVYVPWEWDNIFGYLLITVGFYFNFINSKKTVKRLFKDKIFFN